MWSLGSHGLAVRPVYGVDTIHTEFTQNMLDRLSNPEVGLMNQVSVSPKLPKFSLSSPVFVPGERMTPLVGTL